MATIAPTLMTGSGSRVVSTTVLTSSDTFVYNESANQVLELTNDTAGPLTVNIDGAGGTVVPVAGIGNVSVAAGYTTAAIATLTKVAIPLNTIKQFCQGTIAVTGGVGIKATLLNFA